MLEYAKNPLESIGVDGWMGGWVDKWMGGWVDEWMGNITIFSSLPSPRSQLPAFCLKPKA
ncbi:hypothetical protein C7B77_02625 [Chamaesiphon polymorphus CCALA 037]|uniref:Uncharacterized protein n=1 Tax=Chamaesiphon polymorphus CCALA 037 TaxID=2107692 RepID=A0A2T1GM81_9CYAN|nr:hypothetical protein C7B77_02625 [Chamaesiphon polymorphus CCALA 037]